MMKTKVYSVLYSASGDTGRAVSRAFAYREMMSTIMNEVFASSWSVKFTEVVYHKTTQYTSYTLTGTVDED